MEKREKMELAEIELEELRLWCLSVERDLPIQLYNWLLKAESREDLELRKKCTNLIGVLGSALDRYNWVKYNINPDHILKDSDYPDLDDEQIAMLFDD